MLAHEVPLRRVQRPGLVQHAVWYSDLADVVEVSDVLDLHDVLLRPGELTAEEGGVRCYTPRVAEGVVVLGTQGGAQRAEVAQVEVADALVKLGVRHGHRGLFAEPSGEVEVDFVEEALLVDRETDELPELPLAVFEGDDHDPTIADGKRLSQLRLGGEGVDPFIPGQKAHGACRGGWWGLLGGLPTLF